jgi:hypothetical protein
MKNNELNFDESPCGYLAYDFENTFARSASRRARPIFSAAQRRFILMQWRPCRVSRTPMARLPYPGKRSRCARWRESRMRADAPQEFSFGSAADVLDDDAG